MVDGINGINGFIGQVNAPTNGANGARPASGYDGPRYTEPQDRVTLSDDGKKKGNKNPAAVRDGSNLSTEEKQQVQELKKRDAEVKAHEQAHMAAGGGIVQGGASYQYQRGPDGKTYAVGGEVKIDASSERTPEATIRKMQQVQRAALAPAQPSGTDRAVAARAAQAEAQARLQKLEENDENAETEGEQASTESTQEVDPSAGQTEAKAAANGEPADASPPNAGHIATGTVANGGSTGATPSNTGATGTAAPHNFFSYKADLSPDGSDNSRPKGRKVDLVA